MFAVHINALTHTEINDTAHGIVTHRMITKNESKTLPSDIETRHERRSKNRCHFINEAAYGG